MEDQKDCQSWRNLFYQVEHIKRATRQPSQASIQLTSLINQIKLNNTNKQTLLFQKKEKLKNSQMHPTKRENITNRSITHPKNNLNQLIQNQEAESARLTEKLRHIEFAIGQQRSQNQQLTDTLNLYINNESDMLKVTTKLNHDKQLMINERADILRKIENGKSVQYEVINQLRSARDEQQELCNIQMQKTDHNQHIIKLQQPLPSMTMLKEQFINQTLVNILDNSEELIHMRPYSKFEVKEVLKCFYALNKLSSNNLREKCDYKNLEIIEKEKVRMYSKEELIIDFQKNHFSIDEQFESKICNRYELLKKQLKNLEIQYDLQQQSIKEKEYKLEELQANYTESTIEQKSLEQLKQEQQLMRQWETENSQNDEVSIRYCQFYYSFIIKLFKISTCIKSVTDGFIIYNPTENAITCLNDDWQRNKLLKRYRQLINMRQLDRIEGQESFFQGSQQLLTILKSSRLIRLLACWQTLSNNYNVLTPTTLFGDLIDKTHSQAEQLVRTLTRIYMQFNQTLKDAITSKLKFRIQRKQNFKDAYCIQSPEFYCRDNMKLIEKIEAMKLKNMGTRKHVPADAELNVQQSSNPNDQPVYKTIRRRYFKPHLTSRQQSVRTTILDKSPEYNYSEYGENFASSCYHSNMLSERKHAVQIGNMSVRNMLSIVKKIGTLDATRSKIKRKRNNGV